MVCQDSISSSWITSQAVSQIGWATHRAARYYHAVWKALIGSSIWSCWRSFKFMAVRDLLDEHSWSWGTLPAQTKFNLDGIILAVQDEPPPAPVRKFTSISSTGSYTQLESNTKTHFKQRLKSLNSRSTTDLKRAVHLYSLPLLWNPYHLLQKPHNCVNAEYAFKYRLVEKNHYC